MANTLKQLRAFIRLDGTGRVVSSSPIFSRRQPKVGKWREIPIDNCCPVGTTTTTTTIR